MSEEAKIEKVGESAYFVVDFENYVGTVVPYNPTVAQQTVVHSPTPGEVMGEELDEGPLEVPHGEEEEAK